MAGTEDHHGTQKFHISRKMGKWLTIHTHVSKVGHTGVYKCTTDACQLLRDKLKNLTWRQCHKNSYTKQ